MLTRERGKIAAFAKGARRQGSRLLASTNPFCFGEFRLYEGRTSYSISEASIQNYFAPLREDFENACYGMYFLEVMDYYTRENNEESTAYAAAFIVGTPVEKLYTFTVTEKVLKELQEITDEFRKRFIDRNFKSLEILIEKP